MPRERHPLPELPAAPARAARPSLPPGRAELPESRVTACVTSPTFPCSRPDGAAWGHYAVICFTDTQSNGGAPAKELPCKLDGRLDRGWHVARHAGHGGRAGAGELRSTGSAQGNPNPVYYSMAAKAPSAFHSVTQGDITVNCNGPRNCFWLCRAMSITVATCGPRLCNYLRRRALHFQHLFRAFRLIAERVQAGILPRVSAAWM